MQLIVCLQLARAASCDPDVLWSHPEYSSTSFSSDPVVSGHANTMTSKSLIFIWPDNNKKCTLLNKQCLSKIVLYVLGLYDEKLWILDLGCCSQTSLFVFNSFKKFTVEKCNFVLKQSCFLGSKVYDFSGKNNTFISIRSWGGTDLAFDFALYHPPFPSPDLVCNANRREFAKHARSSCSGQCLRTRSIIANARTKCRLIMLPMRVRKTLACIRGAFEVISLLINIYNGNTVWSLMTASSEPIKKLNSDLNT